MKGRSKQAKGKQGRGRRAARVRAWLCGRAGRRLPRPAGETAVPKHWLRVRLGPQQGRPLRKVISEYVFQCPQHALHFQQMHISYLKLLNNSILSCIISASAPMKF